MPQHGVEQKFFFQLLLRKGERDLGEALPYLEKRISDPFECKSYII